MEDLNQSGSLLLGKDDGISNSTTNLSEYSLDQNGITKKNGKLAAQTGSQSTTNQNNSQLDPSKACNAILAAEAEKKIGQPIEKIDVLKAGVILMRKLSTEDISYLSKVARKGSYSQEEYQHSQEILLSSLSVEDINALKKLGKKYGSELKILNPNAKS